MFGPKMYRKTSNIPLRDEPQFVLKEGIQKNSRAVANERGNGVELVYVFDFCSLGNSIFISDFKWMPKSQPSMPISSSSTMFKRIHIVMI